MQQDKVPHVTQKLGKAGVDIAIGNTCAATVIILFVHFADRLFLTFSLLLRSRIDDLPATWNRKLCVWVVLEPLGFALAKGLLGGLTR